MSIWWLKKIRDDTGVDPIQKKNLDADRRIQGVGCSNMLESTPRYIAAPAEYVRESPRRTARIVMGVDRPGNRLTGYGGLGHGECGCVDIVAGPLGPAARATTANPEALEADPHPTLDAARIKVVQKSNIDKDYSLTSGKIGNKHFPRSFVLAKADGIRLVSRTAGIKIITGADSGTADSTGKDSKTTYGIDLIAGNREDENTKWSLQPLVKGNNLIIVLGEILTMIGTLSSMIENMSALQRNFDLAIQTHSHVTTTPSKPTSPSFDLLIASPQHNINRLMKIDFPSFNARVEQARLIFDMIKNKSNKNYVLSQFNNTN
jgi:hypothetical protein